jgi:hypothetical protein
MKIDMEKHLQVAHHVAKLLDTNFKVLGFKFGLDPLLGLVPGLGDFITFLFGMYVAWIAMQCNVPSHVIARMVLNTLIDLGLGALPVVGDIADFFYKSNVKNYDLLKEHLIQENTIEGQKVEYK